MRVCVCVCESECQAEAVGSAVRGIMIRELFITVLACSPLLNPPNGLLRSPFLQSIPPERKNPTPKDTLFATVDHRRHLFHTGNHPLVLDQNLTEDFETNADIHQM